MLFNSYEFILLFLPITVIVFYNINRMGQHFASLIWLVICSLFFYGFWNFAYLPLMLISMGFNFLVGKEISETAKLPIKRKAYLYFGIVANLALLGYFKYFNFFIDNINIVFKTEISNQNIILPLAISFFTFQQIAFLVDSYNYKLKDFNIVNYLLFVSFFPQLIAGPIVHHSEMMPQFAAKLRSIDYKKAAQGFYIFSIGLFKKVMIADNLSPIVKEGFDLSESLNFAEAWITSLSYTFQLYFDFSGYTDMAWGAALILGIQLPQNFNSPYKATSIRDFWRRWHMTLSRFLRDYLYIPLGGNQKGFGRTLLNLFITFVLGGFWHGAAWTFVIWGALHGIALIIERLVEKTALKMPKFLAIALSFAFVNVAWIFFRALKFADAKKVLSGMVDVLNVGQFQNIHFGYSQGFWLLAAAFLAFYGKNSNELSENFKPKIGTLLLAIGLFLVAFFQLNKLSEFIYFQF